MRPVRAGSVDIGDIREEGRRLTGGYHLSEDQLAVARLKRIHDLAVPLGNLCLDGGVFRGPIFKRIYAADPEHGEPYVSAKDLVQADIRPAGFLSRKHGALLDELRLEEGMILLTCSGMNLGKAIWTRSDMAGLCATHDLIRIRPDEQVVPPGFVYAFLASRYGHAWVRKLIYGGNIKHVEPHHVASLPVPRLGEELERRVHELVEEAARGRSETAALRAVSRRILTEALQLSNRTTIGAITSFATFSVHSSSLGRLDAVHFSPSGMDAQAELITATSESSAVGDIARVFTPPIFKRQRVDDPAFGYPYYSGSELFQLDPRPRGYLSRRSRCIQDYIVSTDWLLVQDAGQLGGLIGQITRVSPKVSGGVVSNHLVRVVPRCREDAAYLFALLGSPHGYRCIVRHAFGTSIPQLDPDHIRGIRVPWPESSVRQRIASPILESWSLLEQADELEDRARTLVEQAIEAAS